MESITLDNYKEILGLNIDEYDWNNISIYQKLSEEFIREFQDRVNWLWISKYQKISEDFIKEFQEEVDWDNISKFQKLSESFIREFEYRVDISILTTNSVFYCGKHNRCIYISESHPELIHIGCFEGTKQEAIEAITKRYYGTERDEYISKVNKCFNI